MYSNMTVSAHRYVHGTAINERNILTESAPPRDSSVGHRGPSCKGRRKNKCETKYHEKNKDMYQEQLRICPISELQSANSVTIVPHLVM